MINVLIRTSSRPLGFQRTITEILRQSDKIETNIIVSADNEESIAYVESYDGINHIVECVPREKMHADHNPYNEYYNEMIQKAKPGWVWRIDDDDIVMPEALWNIQKHVLDADVCYIFNMLVQNNTVIPQNRTKLTYCDIATPNYVVHTKHNDLCRWKPVRGGDYRYLQDILHANPSLRIEYVDRILCKVDSQSFGDGGKIAPGSEYLHSLLLEAYRDGKTWILELSSDELQRRWCKQLADILQRMTQRAVHMDATKIKRTEWLRILDGTSADYFVVSDPHSMLYQKDDRGDYLFEQASARLLFLHHQFITRTVSDEKEAAQRVAAYRRVAERGYHICFDTEVGSELHALEIGPVCCLGPSNLDGNQFPAATPSARPTSVEFFVEEMICCLHLPVQRPDCFSEDCMRVEAVFKAGTAGEIDDAVQVYLRKHGGHDGFLVLGCLYKERNMNSQAFNCYYAALKMAPENRATLKELKELQLKLPGSGVNLEAAEDLQKILLDASHE